MAPTSLRGALARRSLILMLVASGLTSLAVSAAAGDKGPVRNGFQLSPAAIPVDEILRGGPPRDGIPALNAPQLLPAADSPWHDDEIVVGVVREDQARAYPLAILNWHELVNDELGKSAILVSYCPLCGTALVFDRKVAGSVRTFGVSGLLYQSDLLLYDRETESLWSQIEGSAVTGESKGIRLRVLRSALEPWGTWKRRHPHTTVLSLDTGHRRDYGKSPYGDYASSDRLVFPAPLDPRYHPKTPTVGARLASGAARAYTATEVVRAGGQVEDELEGHPLVITFDPESQVFDVQAPSEIEIIEGYWFAWAAFHPATTVFVAVDGSE